MSTELLTADCWLTLLQMHSLGRPLVRSLAARSNRPLLLRCPPLSLPDLRNWRRTWYHLPSARAHCHHLPNPQWTRSQHESADEHHFPATLPLHERQLLRHTCSKRRRGNGDRAVRFPSSIAQRPTEHRNAT